MTVPAAFSTNAVGSVGRSGREEARTDPPENVDRFSARLPRGAATGERGPDRERKPGPELRFEKQKGASEGCTPRISGETARRRKVHGSSRRKKTLRCSRPKKRAVFIFKKSPISLRRNEATTPPKNAPEEVNGEAGRLSGRVLYRPALGNQQRPDDVQDRHAVPPRGSSKSGVCRRSLISRTPPSVERIQRSRTGGKEGRPPIIGQKQERTGSFLWCLTCMAFLLH